MKKRKPTYRSMERKRRASITTNPTVNKVHRATGLVSKVMGTSAGIRPAGAVADADRKAVAKRMRSMRKDLRKRFVKLQKSN